MKRIAIRRKTYHCVDGFVVSTGGSIYDAHIFVRTRAGAEIVRDALFLTAKANEAIDTVLKERR